MSNSGILLLLLAATATLAIARGGARAPDVKIKPAVNIVPYKPVVISPIESTSSPSSLPMVYRWKNCDGARGKVLAFRLTDCAPDRVCEAPVEQCRDTELDVVPSRNIRQLGMRIKLIRNKKEGPITFLEVAFQNTTVEGGTLYRISASGGGTQFYKDQLVHLQYGFYDVDTGEDEFCTDEYFNYV